VTRPHEGAGAAVSRLVGALALLVLSLLFVGAVVLELRLGVAGGGAAASGGAVRAESPGGFWFFLGIHALTAAMLFAASLRTAGVPLPVAPRPLVIAGLSLGVLMGLWFVGEWAVTTFRLSNQVSDDPGKTWFVRGLGLLMLAVCGYFIWEFGISEIVDRLHPPPRDDEDDS
jgi:hypothetical protein